MSKNFNASAAQWAAELVSKMDEDEARVFTTMVVNDVIQDTIKKNQRTLQRHLDHVVSKRIERVKKALATTYISKRMSDDVPKEEALAHAAALALIEKAQKAPIDYAFEREHPRGDKGRFKVKIRHALTKPLNDKQAKAVGASDRRASKLPDHQKARYQEEYMQVANFLRTFQDADAADSDFRITLKDRNTNEVYTVPVQGTKAKDLWDPSSEEVVEIEARPSGLSVGGASFGLVSALGASQGRAHQTASTMDTVDSKFLDFANDWNVRGDGKSTNAGLYQRLSTGSEYLGQIAPQGSTMQMATTFGRFVGEHGAEAEKVFGPSTRKAMYRYRGTEKTPDRELLSDFKQAAIEQSQKKEVLGDDDRRRLNSAVGRAELEWRVNQAKEKGVHIDAIRVPQETRKKIREDIKARIMEDVYQEDPTKAIPTANQVAVRHMQQKVLSNELWGLQLASGHTPPSEGVIINAKGEIVTQASGYGDDHYLPFNLKNLGALKGGEYVRTRSVGGLTSEDIYAGMMSGARAMTVVSRSGTFRLEFEDDFRGGRRHNDKAARMVDRYEKLLDAIQSEKVDRANQEFPDYVEELIHEEVHNEMEPLGYNRMEIEEEIQGRLQKYKQAKGLTEVDLMEVDRRFNAAQARGEISNTPKDKIHARRDIRAQLQEEKSLRYQLDGHGYKAAMEALKEQFPYYLKDPKAIPRGRRESFSGERDKGYVKPRYNRPAAALEGYFDSSITGYNNSSDAEQRTDGKAPWYQGTGKYSADTADYQNLRGREKLQRVGGNGRRVAAAQEEPGTQGDEPGVPRKKEEELSPAAASRKKSVERMKQFDAEEAAVEMQMFIRDKMNEPTPDRDKFLNEIHKLEEPEFREWFKKPENRHKFTHYFDNEGGLEALDKTFVGVDDKDGWNSVRVKYERALGMISRVPFSTERLKDPVPKYPFKFEGREFEDSRRAQQELTKLGAHRKGRTLAGKSLDQMTSAEFREELSNLKRLEGFLKTSADIEPRELDALLERSSFDPKNALVHRAKRNPKEVRNAAIDTHKAWALRAAIDIEGESKKGKPEQPAAPEVIHTGEPARPGETPASQEEAKKKLKDINAGAHQRRKFLVENSRDLVANGVDVNRAMMHLDALIADSADLNNATPERADAAVYAFRDHMFIDPAGVAFEEAFQGYVRNPEHLKQPKKQEE